MGVFIDYMSDSYSLTTLVKLYLTVDGVAQYKLLQ